MYSNQNGTLLLVTVNSKCSGCGACSAMCRCFVDGLDGKAIPVNGGCFTAEELPEVKEAMDTCPEGAIECTAGSVVKANGKVTIADVKAFVQKEFIEYVFPRPKYKDFSFDWMAGVEHYSISSHYDYDSYSEAERAGMREVQRLIFDRLDTYAKDALVAYKHKRLTPLITYAETEDNYYFQEKKRVKDLLHALVLELHAVTGKEVADKNAFLTLSSEPELGYNGKKFEQFTKIEEYCYSRVQCDVEAPDWYSSWIETDDIDTYETGFLGREKEVTKWAYRAYEVPSMVRDHLTSGVKSELRDYFDEVVSGYSFSAVVRPIEDEIKQKGQQLLKML